MARESETISLLSAEAVARIEELEFRHPLNPNSEVHMRSLGDRSGLRRLGIHLTRVPPGKESFVYHTHGGEEEFIYILSGRGIAEIGDEEFEVKAGDFMGFGAPSVGHHLRNPFDADLVYLMGGERHEIEVGDYPRLRKRGIRTGTEMQVVEWTNLAPFWK
jgi:uncharacterized cupin superfamily protein